MASSNGPQLINVASDDTIDDTNVTKDKGRLRPVVWEHFDKTDT